MLVAHRGQSETLPENTLESIEAAIGCGARAVEFDLQLSADHVPVLCHDRTLRRTAGLDIDVTKTMYADLKKIHVGEPGRFGDQFRSVRLADLREAVTRLEASPDIEVFVDVKGESIKAFGRETVAGILAEQLRTLQERCVVIAGDPAMLALVRANHAFRIGWIIPGFSKNLLAGAAESKPDFLVMNRRHCLGRRHDFSADPWSWMIYHTSDPDQARALFKQGVTHVETNDICAMLKHHGQSASS